MTSRIIFVWLFCISLAYGSCNKIIIKNYNNNLNNTVITFILLNHTSIKTDIVNRNGEYLDSLLTQLNLPNNNKTIDYLIELVNLHTDSYSFAKALTKDVN